MENLRGRLLISNGSLYDPNFRHTVVLIVEHNEDGALGLVLNRPLTMRVAEAVPELAPLVDPDEHLFVGGPVQPEAAVILAEATDPASLDQPVLERIGLVGELDSLSTIFVRARVFGGYAGWGPGQLESEVERDDWILENASPNDVFTDDPQHLWKRVLERKGGPFAMLATMPFDPSLN